MFLGVPQQASAEAISVAASVDQTTVRLDGNIFLTIAVNGTQDVSPVAVPTIDGFDVRYQGPASQFRVINGEVFKSASFSYRLYPRKVGKFVIPSFSLNVAGQSYTTDPITVEVLDVGTPANNPNAAGQQEALSLEDRIILQLQVPGQDVYVNEKVPVKVLLLWTGVNLDPEQYPVIDVPGVSLEKFSLPKQSAQVVNGLNYNILEFNTFLYPTREGKVALGPASMVASLLIQDNSSNFDSFFDSFFNRVSKRPLQIKSNTTELNVLPLPEEGKPVPFSNGVGQYQFEATISPQEVAVGDPVTVKMAVSGTGRVDALDLPVITASEQLKVYEPNIKLEGDKKILEQVIIPTTENLSEIPALSFHYFDPVAGKYQIITRGPFPMKVLKGTYSPSTPVIENSIPTVSSTVETLGEDIVFIKEDLGDIKPSGYRLYAQTSFVVLALVLFIFWCVSYVYLRYSHRMKTDPAFARKLLAPRFARQGMRNAKQMLSRNDVQAFYACLFKTLQTYLGHSLHLPAKGLTWDSLAHHPKIKSCDPVLREKLKILFEECDRVRYAAMSIDQKTMADSLRRLEELINLWERKRG